MDFLPLYAMGKMYGECQKPDFVYVCGDAYVDHPSFGCAVICRVLESEGFSVGIIAQPDYKSTDDIKAFGKPRLGFLVSSGNIDSMVAHYTASKKRRNDDYYSPGGKSGYRPDRAVIVYCNLIRQSYGDVPIIIGGLEASLRRFAHYDYWSDKVRRSILIDSRADMISYGMGEKSITKIAKLLDRGVPVKKIRDVRGTVICTDAENIPQDHIDTYDYDVLKSDKKAYAAAFRIQSENSDPVSGKPVIEHYGDKIVIQNPPQPMLTREELDAVYALPYMRNYHPAYEKVGGIPAINEVKFSVCHNRGCFGQCNFCAITYNQGRGVVSRSKESVLEEVKKLVKMPDFKGYIHDVGGPTANFRYSACEKQEKFGACKDKRCLAPIPCKNLKVDHEEYLDLLRSIREIDGVKKVFIRSGIRFDYVMLDRDDSFFRELVKYHVSGQLKVAPEHCCDGVLELMGKPKIRIYNEFKDKYFKLTKEIGKEQYLVPYLISSHPGSTLNDAVELALFLKKTGLNPEQVQDFYPTPGTASTCMFYTGTDPFTGKKVYVPDTYEEKRMQRALLQFSRPANAPIIRKALIRAGRSELIGYGKECLVKPDNERTFGGKKPKKEVKSNKNKFDRQRQNKSRKK